ncbi:YeiH family protein [Oenococcus kitaharae]|uniref:YeiH-like putative membrane protein n=1 Tax=Oenococcus kitaharae DSM 17330 TaxID=1045004 RepID=G9WHA1_9LACO|nr:putative sulfate exporter family transporter [Oenococcus kitaharae]EHN59667.1 YeiH-like putative membrane protein [Oenococcus kitaharae DSM 17330]OEY83506.1 membrane protein [Oenococcus kitaharae]OEY85305.1 membrane protein [Oenococcus kitaharae]OEY86159.1 membrane protein [Oenococcus kitaharae]
MRIKRNMINGICLTLILSVAARFLAQYLPNLGAEAIAMLLGIIVGNTIFTGSKWSAGVKWAEKYPIEIGIALMGLTVTLRTIASLRIQGVIFIVLQMTATILFVMWIGQRLIKVPSKSAMLMASGNAVCGSSAIASVAPAIGANDDQRRTAVATVSLSGVVLLFALPVLGPVLFGQQNLLISALIGGTVQSVGQVVGTAALVNPTVVTFATLFKMLRVILLSVVVFVFARIAAKKDQGQGEEETAVRAVKKVSVPWFVMTFIVFVLINSFLSLPNFVNDSAKTVSSFFGVVNLAGIGLNLKWQTIKASGQKYLAYGLLTLIFQALCAILLIQLLLA